MYVETYSIGKRTIACDFFVFVVLIRKNIAIEKIAPMTTDSIIVIIIYESFGISDEKNIPISHPIIITKKGQPNSLSENEFFIF